MTLRCDLSDFWRQVHRISREVEDIHIDLGRAFDPIDEILFAGKEIQLSELKLVNGLLSYEGRQVLLYIPRHGERFLAARDDPDKGNRFHVADCVTLDSMRQHGHFEKYVATNNLTGVFSIHGYGVTTAEELSADVELRVCINCLKKINYKNYRHASQARQTIWRPFSIAEFFNTFSTSFKHLPKGLSNSPSASKYTEDWPAISAEVRHQSGFRCDECQVQLRDTPGLLHVHHMNGVKGDNRRENLRPLCADCHRKQPMHDYMFVSAEDMSTIARLRRQQGLMAKGWDKAFKLADLSVHGVMGEARARGWEEPEVGFEFADADGRVAAELELAWPRRKVGIYLTEKPALNGWKLQNPAEYLGGA